jgi:hypothetical protein
MYHAPYQTGGPWKSALNGSFNQKLRHKLLNGEMLHKMQEEAGLFISLGLGRANGWNVGESRHSATQQNAASLSTSGAAIFCADPR